MDTKKLQAALEYDRDNAERVIIRLNEESATEDALAYWRGRRSGLEIALQYMRELQA